mmetsp:Transcript_38226/g.95690  ORF Transcript_38226/g.95690 Transcript_38226/m.95690 type:complete len:287 (-) Transcript_38226:143-1003(-)
MAGQTVKKRLPTANINELNIKWTRPANPRGTYRFMNQSSTAVNIWLSPRHSGLLDETKGPPQHYIRDKAKLEASRDLLAGVKSTVNKPKERIPYGVDTGFYDHRRLGTFETYDKRQSVTRHQWGVHSNPHGAAAEQQQLPYNRTIRRSTAAAPVPKPPTPKEVPAFKSQKQQEEEELAHVVEERRQKERERRKLIKDLRDRMKEHFTDTKNLPMNLWSAFKKTDRDNSGRIDLEEFVGVCEEIGLSGSVIGPQGQKVLFSLCDKDGGGSIDFNEFLNTLVGNLVKL